MNTIDPSRRLRPDIAKILGLGQDWHDAWWRQWQWQLIVAGLLIVAMLAVALWGMGRSRGGVRYETVPVTRGQLVVIVTATGSVQPTNKVDISSELSGTIRKVLVDYNSPVRAGQPLAELDTDKLQASVESSRAKLGAANARVSDAEATVEEKRLDYERKRQLSARQVTSTHDLELAQAAFARAEAALESAKADVAAAAADLKLNQTNLAKSCICSPISGVVLSRNVEPGQTVATNFQAPVLFTIAEDLTKMELQVDVDEADVGKVRPGQLATFTVDAYPDRRFSARIRELRYGSEVVQGVVTYKAVLSTDNSDLLLRPGMTATAEIRVEEIADALTVPNAALRFVPPSAEDGADDRSFLQKLLPGRPRFRPASQNETDGPERSIWLLDNGKARPVAVTIGATDGKRTQISKGEIAQGQPVIVDTVSRR